MTGRTAEIVTWVTGRQNHLLETVAAWARIGSHSLDGPGLARMADAVAAECGRLGVVHRHAVPPRQWIDDQGRSIEEPLGTVLSLRHVAPRERLRVLLAIHYDTVYPPRNEPPQVELAAAGTILRGPGVADAKGGLVVLLTALEACFRHGAGDTLSWEVLVNADEELGSPGSAAVLQAAAGRNDLGLIFEPALDESGSLAAARKGSGNFTIVVHGRAAHAGRRLTEGRNAVVAAAELATLLVGLTDEARGISINVAAIHGGKALNVVPDLAVVRVNVRTVTEADAAWVEARLAAIVAEMHCREGFSAALTGSFHCPPKPFDGPTRLLFEHVAACGHDLGLAIKAAPTGGVCDGNKLAAAGLPTLDTLGVRGGGIHSDAEYLVVESLAERAALVAILLYRLADGTLPWPNSAREPPPCL